MELEIQSSIWKPQIISGVSKTNTTWKHQRPNWNNFKRKKKADIFQVCQKETNLSGLQLSNNFSKCSAVHQNI